MADRSVTPRHPTELVAQDQEVTELALETAATRVHRDELAGVGAGVQPADPDLRLRVAHHSARVRGGQGPVTGDMRRRVAVAEQ
jgi:hypothetical protein